MFETNVRVLFGVDFQIFCFDYGYIGDRVVDNEPEICKKTLSHEFNRESRINYGLYYRRMDID